MNTRKDPVRTPRRWFWGLTLMAILATGVLGRAVAADPSPLTGIMVLASGLILVVAATLAGRILLVLSPLRHAPVTLRRPAVRTDRPGRNDR